MTAEPALPVAGHGRRVTPDTLVVAPTVVGRILAEPWRRAAGMAVDLVAVGLLSLLSGPWLGLGTGALLIVLLGNAPTAPIALKAARTVCRLLGAVVAVLSLLALGHVSLLRNDGLHLDALSGHTASPAMALTVSVPPEASASELRQAVGQLQQQVDALKAEHKQLEAGQSSWTGQARTFANTLGVTFGWSGVYFTLLAGALGGRTLGKRVVGTRAMKVNGTPFTFFDAFVRNGGYVAGVAMGLMGFIKLLWEPNRQAVEDRIASTVVVRG